MHTKKSLAAATVAVSLLASVSTGASGRREADRAGSGPVPSGVEPPRVAAQNVDPTTNADGNYNIVMITVDQEQHFGTFPAGSAYEARELLAELGTTFEKHYACATMSTSSRSVLYTGRHITDTLMIDNTDFDWQGPLSSSDILTVGDRMRSADYYSAYKGKWHMGNSSTLSEVDDELTDLDAYGFSDWNVSGDYIGKMWEGYEKDPEIVSAASQWLRSTGAAKNGAGQSFFLAVNLINPHDIMYYNTDPTWSGPIPVGGAPDDPLYRKTYTASVPSSFSQDVSVDTLPAALQIFKTFMAKQTGPISSEADWKDFQNFYYNCIQDSDNNLMNLLQTLIDLKMLDNTIIIFTADHGEMDGAHGLKGKGGFMYEQNIHVPLIIYHPEYRERGGQRVNSVTSHIDLATTLVNMTHLSAERKAALTAGLPGGNLMELVENPAGSIREGALFCAELISTTMAKAHMDSSGNIDYYTFDTSVRGFCRAIVTERYKFARYFSLRFNSPTTLEELYANNDVELYDLQNDPEEMNNLAADPGANGALIMEMNARLNGLIAREIGLDDGSEAVREIANYQASLRSQGSGGCNAGAYPFAVGGGVLLLALLRGLRRRK